LLRTPAVAIAKNSLIAALDTKYGTLPNANVFVTRYKLSCVLEGLNGVKKNALVSARIHRAEQEKLGIKETVAAIAQNRFHRVVRGWLGVEEIVYVDHPSRRNENYY